MNEKAMNNSLAAMQWFVPIRSPEGYSKLQTGYKTWRKYVGGHQAVR